LIQILTNFPRFPQQWRVEGTEGVSIPCTTVEQFMARAADASVLLINSDSRMTYDLCGRKLTSRMRVPLVVADMLLSQPPPGLINNVKASARRLLLQSVDHFIHYFRDLSGFHRHYKLGPQRSSFVPFKHNMEAFATPELVAGDGDYIVCVGASFRDYDLLLEAVDGLPYPLAVPELRPDFLAKHGARFGRLQQPLPQHVRFLADDFSQQRLAQILGGAKLVVLPIRPENLKASGVTVYLNAMRLGRCVIVSEGPGVGDVLRDEAVIVPPADALALRQAIQHYWDDDDARRAVAQLGLRYACSLGEEEAFYQRILQRVVAHLKGQTLPEDARCYVRE
jgi:glycosyltransferase involved in cell wall biosynthesis